MKTMRAWRFYGFEDMRLDEVPRPEARPGWAVVKVRVVQPSITEALLAKGVKTLALDYIKETLATRSPVQLFGHEFCGEVVELGEGVAGFQVGDRVTAAAKIPCMSCDLCKRGLAAYCHEWKVFGFHMPGAFAEYATIPANNLTKVPDVVSDNEAATIQPLSDCVAAVKTADIQMGESVVCIGQGSMGISCMMVARVTGAGKIIAIDVRKEALRSAQQLGADVTVNASQVDPVQAVLEVTHGLGADVVFETAGGSPEQGLAGTSTFEQALAMVREAGKVVQISWFGEPFNVDIDAFRKKFVRYLFPESADNSILAHSVHLVASGRVPTKPLITQVLQGIEQVPRAFEITANKSAYHCVNPAQVVIA